MSNSLKRIDSYAFYGCERLESVQLPPSIESIGKQAFAKCYHLGKLTMPKHIEASGSTFKDSLHVCDITITDSDRPWYIQSSGAPWRNCVNDLSITFAYGIERIPAGMFHDLSHLKKLAIPGSVREIEGGAFSGCHNLTELTLPASLDAGGGDAPIFEQCARLQRLVFTPGTGVWHDYTEDSYGRLPWSGRGNVGMELVIVEGIDNIGGYAFHQCSRQVAHLVLPESVKTIGEGAFKRCDLESISLGSAVETIGERAFEHSGIHSVAVAGSPAPGDRTIYVGDYAFMNCPDLRTVSLP